MNQIFKAAHELARRLADEDHRFFLRGRELIYQVGRTAGGEPIWNNGETGDPTARR